MLLFKCTLTYCSPVNDVFSVNILKYEIFKWIHFISSRQHANILQHEWVMHHFLRHNSFPDKLPIYTLVESSVDALYKRCTLQISRGFLKVGNKVKRHSLKLVYIKFIRQFSTSKVFSFKWTTCVKTVKNACLHVCQYKHKWRRKLGNLSYYASHSGSRLTGKCSWSCSVLFFC